MPFWGRGYRWMFRLTGLPGWLRGFGGGFGFAGFGRGAWMGFRGNPFWNCRWFPWLPRWWWTGIYGRVIWTPQGPVLEGQNPNPQTGAAISGTPATIAQNFQSKEEEIAYLENELKAMEEEKKWLEREMEQIRKKLEELKKS